jgi:hypothetical protein
MSELSVDVREYLRRCGLPERKLAECNEDTRMYHDLGLYGDVAEAYIDVLANVYGIDLTDFQFEKFFPREFQGETALGRVLLWLIPFASTASRRGNRYRPLTLAMIERAMRSKRWQE